MTKQWENWSGVVKCNPAQIAAPRSIDEIVSVVNQARRADQSIRVVGSGHSFTRVVETNQILMTLDNFQGVESADLDARTAVVRGGTKLKRLGEELYARGLAMENLGDIDVQSIAGSISTGTHGTGVKLGTLSTQVIAMTLVTASGEVLELSAEKTPDQFKAAQVSLGMLGIVVRVTLQLQPAYRLHKKTGSEKWAGVMANVDQYKAEHRNFEFYYFPFTDAIQTIYLNQTEAPPSESTRMSELSTLLIDNYLFLGMSELCRVVPRMTRTTSKIAGSAVSMHDKVDHSHRIYATPRLVRFNEMEYNVPADQFEAVMTELRACIDRHQFDVHFPIECRWVKADDIWLSPAYEREAAYIAVHMYKGMPYRTYFDALEAIFRKYDGRPHWGKMHTRSFEELLTLYPKLPDFLRVRQDLDPTGVFVNDYTRELFNIA